MSTWRQVAAAATNRSTPPVDRVALATQTFGAPWLDLVVRACKASALASDLVNPSMRSLVDASAEMAWNVALKAQAMHRACTQQGPPPADARDALRELHAHLDRLVSEAEETVRLAQTAALTETAADLRRALDEVRDKLTATTAAVAELQRTDAP